jgi:hypothetical protein
MTKDEQEVASADAPNIEMHKAENFKTLYANWVQASFTPFDISLVVGQAMSGNAPSTFEVEQKARIIFHPLEAKVVIAMLGKAVETYEKQFGAIPVPGGAVEMAVAVVGAKEEEKQKGN